ncbi:hypothetical protein C8Q78DRAFT_1056243 [Trametes maxima]|nr:hypothetical protein C8Q78DRAFT_1056243 [Trametes maxima]
MSVRLFAAALRPHWHARKLVSFLAGFRFMRGGRHVEWSRRKMVWASRLRILQTIS